MIKPAETNLSIVEDIKNRWSPRAFDSKPVEPEKLERIFEAARWSASSYNEQPWRFIAGIKDRDNTWDMIFDCLADANKIWCGNAPVLILLVAKKTFSHNNRANNWSIYDLGQSGAYMCVQATREGLFVHQMAGFKPDKAAENFSVPDDYEVKTAMAVGYYGDPDILPDNLKKSELNPRSRKQLGELVFDQKWGNTAGFIKS